MSWSNFWSKEVDVTLEFDGPSLAQGVEFVARFRYRPPENRPQ